MKLNYLGFCLLVIISLYGCEPANKTSAGIENKRDSLKNLVKDIESDIDSLKEKLNGIRIDTIRTEYGTLYIYKPDGLKIRLNNKRPEFSDSIYFCVPAAFTTPDTTIDGLFYIDGKKINGIRHPKLNGAVMFGEGAFNFIESDQINSALFSEIEKMGSSFFQQQLLIKDSVIVQDTLFKKKKNKRRALIQIGAEYAVAESDKAVIIKEFQLALLSIGVVNAIYLDMGTWSEGWYRSKDNKKIVIAESKVNTHKQTNWLTFETGNGN